MGNPAVPPLNYCQVLYLFLGRILSSLKSDPRTFRIGRLPVAASGAVRGVTPKNPPERQRVQGSRIREYGAPAPRRAPPDSVCSAARMGVSDVHPVAPGAPRKGTRAPGAPRPLRTRGCARRHSGIARRHRRHVRGRATAADACWRGGNGGRDDNIDSDARRRAVISPD